MIPTFLKKNFINIVVVILLIVVLLQTCDKNKSTEQPQIKIIRDTTWIIKDSTIHSKPQVVAVEQVPVQFWDTEYLPDTNYAKLLKQYTQLAEEFLSKKVQVDSVKIDTVGYVKVTDTVTKNLIVARKYDYNIKYPIIKETQIIPEKKRNQFYVGGNLQGNKVNIVNQISAGLLYKNKKDQIYGVNAGLDIKGNVQYGISSYWKISLHKK